ncbi:MAG: phosphoglucomutase/phosphomannomutase family protein [Pseudobutyrivibrio sp.]|nr:phosphoglucomutase/phosphomannomutase family protein [Pseudobutyrivibrio sp.]
MIKFGTGGWRATIGDEFIRSNIELVAKALSMKIKDEGKEKLPVIIGYDKRFLSKETMQWLGQVFAAEGIKAFLVNKAAPTPLIMFYVLKHDLEYGLMVTASHNPALYNGIKIFTKGGRDADENTTNEIEAYAKRVEDEGIAINSMEYNEAVEKGLIEEIYPLNEYLDNIIANVNMEAIKDANLRVALDPMYGVSEIPLKTLLMTSRCDIVTIHDSHDTLFGGKLPAPSASTLRPLIAQMMDYKFDIGIATDGDADRLGVVDDKGRFLHPNDILVLLYYYLVKYKKWTGPVVRNIATTHMLDRVAERFGEKCYEVPVGFKHISAKMTEVNALIGGESSGGLTVRGHINGKDGIYAAMLLIEMIAVTGKSISQVYDEITEECGAIHMEERDYHFTLEEKERMTKLLMEEKKLPELPFEIDHVSYLDGSKVYFKNGGWVIGRFSGTEPLIRIFCEMPDGADAIKVCQIYEKFLGL